MKKNMLNKNDQQKGAIIVIVALVLFLLIGFFGLAVDINMFGASREQTEHYARFAALTGLETFHTSEWCDDTGNLTTRSTPGARRCTNCEKYSLALKRANQLLEDNRIVGDKNKIPFLTAASNIAAECKLKRDFKPKQPDQSKVAQLVPGYISENETLCANYPIPCFLPLPMLADNQTAPSAFQIVGSQYMGLQTWWVGKLFKLEPFDPVGRAVATLVPRHGCFVVDISASSVRETHPALSANYNQYQTWIDSGFAGDGGKAFAGTSRPYIHSALPGEGWGYEFSYYLKYFEDSNNNSGPLTNHPEHGDIGTLNLIGWSNHDRVWQFLKKIHPRRSEAPANALPQRTHHYHDDYVSKKTFGDNHYTLGVHDELHPDPNLFPERSIGSYTGDWYNIDMAFLNQPSIAADYRGPEPLRSIFSAIATGMRRFEERRVAGDKACVVFYDRRVTWPRMFKLTDDFSGIRNSLNFSDRRPDGTRYNDPVLPDPIDINLLPGSYQGIEKIIRHGLFPSDVNNSYTNAILALAIATQELVDGQQDSPIKSADFIANISDGLANCQSCQGVRSRPGSNQCMPNACGNGYYFYRQAMNDIFKIVGTPTSAGTTWDVPIHSILIGNSVIPHTLDIPDLGKPGECLTDLEYRKEGISLLPVRGFPPASDATWQTRFSRASPAFPFYEANVDWYKTSMYTKGLWLPIRNGNCNPAQTIFDSRGNPCEPSRYGLYGSQRRVFDPYCRSQEEQMVDAINQILSANPFILIKPGI